MAAMGTAVSHDLINVLRRKDERETDGCLGYERGQRTNK